MVFIVVPPGTGRQEVFLIDRKNNYYQLDNIFFPHHDLRSATAQATGGQRTDTLLDGELVIDTISPGNTKLRLLLFDCVVVDGENLTKRELGRRYARLRAHIVPPYEQHLKTNKMARISSPFEVLVKPMDLAYGLDTVLLHKMKQLQHGTDGLIFTRITGGYTCGTDRNILKWKPPHENTIDFKIQVRFPPDLAADQGGDTPDYTAEPFFPLLQHVNGTTHEPFDYLDMGSDEWLQWKQRGEQLDDRIVECAWHAPAKGDATQSTWHITRFRDDKQNGNHKSTVTRILQSIQDGVEEGELIELVSAIREAWKSPERVVARSSVAPQGLVPKGFAIRGGGGPGPPMVRGGMPGIRRR